MGWLEVGAMMRLLWLCVIALGVVMWWEISLHLKLKWMFRVQRALLYVAIVWLLAFAEAFVWHLNHP